MGRSETFGGYGRVSQGGVMEVYVTNPDEISTNTEVTLTGKAKKEFQIQKILQHAPAKAAADESYLLFG